MHKGINKCVFKFKRLVTVNLSACIKFCFVNTCVDIQLLAHLIEHSSEVFKWQCSGICSLSSIVLCPHFQSSISLKFNRPTLFLKKWIIYNTLMKDLTFRW